MRSLRIAASLGLVGVMMGCSTAPGSDRASVANDQLTTMPAASFVTLTTPSCPSTAPCPAYVVRDVNEGTAGEGVGNLDFSQTTFTKETMTDLATAPAGEVVLKGVLGPTQPKTHLPSFIVLEAYRGEAGVTYGQAAHFYQGGSFSPPRPCTPTSCPQGSVTELNTTHAPQTYDSIDVSNVATGQARQAFLRDQIATKSAIVAGKIKFVPNPARRGLDVLTAAQVFVKVTSVAPPPVKRLWVDGAAIRDPSGAAVTLRGWNWGQWGMYQDGDALANRRQKASIVRIPLRWWGVWAEPEVDSRDQNSAATGFISQTHLDALKGMIDAAVAQNLWVDLFVDSNCGQGSFEDGARDYCGTVQTGPHAGEVKSFYNSPEMVEQFAKVWSFLANTYRNKDYIGMYEILPEPHLGCKAPRKCDSYAAALDFYTPMIARIRAIDPVTPIMIGPNGGYDITKIETSYLEIDGEKPFGLIYTGNLLDGPASHVENVGIAATFSSTHTVPVFIQQVGVRNDGLGEGPGTGGEPTAAQRRDAILGALRNANIGWTWWTYRERFGGGDGTGYAPYWRDSHLVWHEETSWLDGIDKHFR
jgi:hypothetical protein